MDKSEILLYQTEDGQTKIDVRFEEKKPFGLTKNKWLNYFKLQSKI